MRRDRPTFDPSAWRQWLAALSECIKERRSVALTHGPLDPTVMVYEALRLQQPRVLFDPADCSWPRR
jgi:hypothetical protein